MNMQGISMVPATRNWRMGLKGSNPTPNYQMGNGNSPFSVGQGNLFPSPTPNFEFLTSPQAMQFTNPQAPVNLPKPPAGLAGLGATSAYIDRKGSGGYTYRLYADDSIQIIKSPTGKTPFVPKGGSLWVAIVNEVGTYASNSGAQTPWKQGLVGVAQAGQQFAQSETGQGLFTSLFDSFLAKQESKSAQERLQAAQAEAEAQKIRGGSKTGWQKAAPYVYMGGGLVVLGTLLSYLSNR